MMMVMTILLVKYVGGANGRDDDVLLFFANKDNYLTIMQSLNVLPHGYQEQADNSHIDTLYVEIIQMRYGKVRRCLRMGCYFIID